MARKLVVTLAAFALVCACVLGAGALAEPATALRPVEAASPCPAAGCASGECHGFDAVPGPDGAHEMHVPGGVVRRAWSATRGTRWWAATTRPRTPA